MVMHAGLTLHLRLLIKLVFREDSLIEMMEYLIDNFNKMKKEVGMLLQKRTDTSAVGIYKIYEENTH